MWFTKKEKESPKELLLEKRPLPTGVKEFHEWSDRIISGTCLTADADSQKFALANELLHCPPNMAFETDVYFIHRLRKYAVNQVADAVRVELRDKAKARLAEEEKKQNPAEVTPTGETNAKVLENSSV